MVSSPSPPSSLLLFFLLTLPFLSIIHVVHLLWPSHPLRPLLLVHHLSRHILFVLGLVLHLISIIPLATVSTEPTTYRETYFYLTGNTSIRFWSSYKLNPCLDIVYICRFSILPEFIHRIEFF
jgi:hypothetical protein